MINKKKVKKRPLNRITVSKMKWFQQGSYLLGFFLLINFSLKLQYNRQKEWICLKK